MELPGDVFTQNISYLQSSVLTDQTVFLRVVPPQTEMRSPPDELKIGIPTETLAKEDKPRVVHDSIATGPLTLLLCHTILILLCLVSYHHALNGTFVFDDNVAILKNQDVTTLPTNLSAIFHHDFWGAPLQSADSHKSFRPLTTLMFHLEYTRWGLGPKHLKAINLLLHCVNTLLVWWLLRGIRSGESHGVQLATIGAALFAVHPVHTEAVCGVVGRAELMFCLTYLVALLLARYRKQLPGPLADVLVIALTATGILFKETAVTIPIACVFLDYAHERLFLHDCKRQVQELCTMRNITYAFATIGLIVWRLWQQNFESPKFKPMDNPVGFSPDPLSRFLSQHFLYAVNWWILLCPQWLCFDWALDCIELITNIGDLRLQAVFAMYSLMIVAFINHKRNFEPIVGLALMVIPFLPALGIIQVGFVIAERLLYVPSIGFCFLVAQSFVYVRSFVTERWLLTATKWALMSVLACMLLRTRERAADWLSEERLFYSALQVCPNNAKVHYNIARVATDKFERERAIHHYHRAIELFPQYESALMNLGNLYREMGDLNSAERYIKAALEVMPQFATAWMNLGIVQATKKNYADALKSYQNALKYRKNYAICHYNIGNLFLDRKMHSEAIHHWQEAVALNPHQPKAWANILTMLDNRALYEDAVRLSAKALEHLPNETSIMAVRANVFGKLKHYVEAETLYKRVLAVEPNNMLAHTNLGVLYHRWGKVSAAIESYQRALKLNPTKAITARDNLRKLLQRKRQEDLLKGNN